MTPPVQLWISLFSHSPHPGLDVRRAYAAWKGEDRIWLLPEIRESFRWNSTASIRYKKSHAKDAPDKWLPYRFQELAIPSERFDRIDVIYIDSKRRVFAPGHDRLPISEYNLRMPERIYQQWIKAADPQHVASKGWKDFMLPSCRGGSVRFERHRLFQQPGPILPITKVDAKQQVVTLSWPPPEADLPRTISPEVESDRYYGHLRFLTLGQERVVVSDPHPEMLAKHVNLAWSAPFDQLFPEGGGPDLLFARQQMCHFATKRGTVPSEVLPIAEPYFSDGESTLEKSWFWPRLCADGETNTLVDVSTKCAFEDSSVKALVRKPEFRRIMDRTTPNKRIWGWVGYFWWELLRDLRSGKKTGTCERCGGPILGKATKRFCSGDANPDCFRQRRAENKRVERSRVRVPTLES